MLMLIEASRIHRNPAAIHNAEEYGILLSRGFRDSGNSLLAVHVLYARFYAHQIQDRELFQQTLKQVLDTPANSYPDKTFVNEVARRKAKLIRYRDRAALRTRAWSR